MRRVSVIGAGSWGTALAVMLDKNGHDVTIWARRKESIENMKKYRENKDYLPDIHIGENVVLTNDLEFAISNADIIVLSVPSKAVRDTATSIAPFVKEGQIIVNVSKGIEEGSLKRLSKVIQECIPKCPVCTLSGPSHAEEVAKDIPTAIVVASEDFDATKIVQQEFMNPMFRVYTNSDEVGVEIGGAFKNLIALASGMCDGLGFGDNTKAALMTRGIAEIGRLGMAMGGRLETFAGLSGIGDLIVTCTSMHSRNRRAGILLGQGKSLDETLKEVKMVVEGVNTAKAGYELSKKYDVDMPITKAINEVLFENKDVKTAVLDLMMREKTSEIKF